MKLKKENKVQISLAVHHGNVSLQFCYFRIGIARLACFVPDVLCQTVGLRFNVTIVTDNTVPDTLLQMSL